MVVDSSALVEALAGSRPNQIWEASIRRQPRVYAPHLLDLEFANALRGLVRTGKVSATKADQALTAMPDLRLIRYPHEPYLRRIWELSSNLTAYDASYVALAEDLEMPLVTADKRLFRFAHALVEIQLI